MHDVYRIESITRDILKLDKEIPWNPDLYIGNHWWVHVLHVDGRYVTVRTWTMKLSPWDRISLRPLPKEAQEDKALRYNDWKIDWSLVHLPSLEPMARVLEYGAKKYTVGEVSGRENWKKPMDKKQILNSMMRHLVRLMEDEELDSESKLPHVGHIMANAMMYSWHTNWKNNLHKSP